MSSDAIIVVKTKSMEKKSKNDQRNQKEEIFEVEGPECLYCNS